MSKIELKFDNTLTQSKIIVGLTNSSVQESGKNYIYNQQEIKQTAIYGIISPLIQINNVVVDFIDVIDFSLKSTSFLPSINLTVHDRYDLIASFDTPGNDNELRIQILPPFDNAYKKINLTFYISNIKINNGYITLSGIYKLPKLTSSKIKSFGQIDTYSLFSNIAKETGLGFASNISSLNNNKYIYCDNKSYMDILQREIKFANFNELQIFDSWIDFWNTLNFADIYERYNSQDSDEDMQIWVNTLFGEIDEDSKPEPLQVTAILTNSPAAENTELYVKNYNIINRGAEQVYFGSDKLYSVYGINQKEYKDYLIQDSDVKRDIFVKYEYLGEYYGDENYLLSEKKRSDFLQKMRTDSIEIELKTPLLALMRGGKVNFFWYRNDAMHESITKELKQTQTINDHRSQLNEYDYNISQDGNFILDKNISGQYMITGCNIKYYNNAWSYIITLNRPASNKINMIKNVGS